MSLVKFLVITVVANLAVCQPPPAADLERLERDVFDGVRRYYEQRTSPHDDVLPFIPSEIRDLLPEVRQKFLGSKKTMSKSSFDAACSGCVAGLDSLLALVRAGLIGEGFVHDGAISFCKLGLGLDEDVCVGAINNYLPEIWYIVNERLDELSGGLACAIILGGKCGKWEEANSWTVDIPAGKPEVIKPVLPEPGSPASKILHITDVHLDLSYTVGTNGDCGKPLCCTNETEWAPTPEQAAGHWGHYNCDVPVWTFEDMLLHIKENHSHEIEYIMMTGDNPPHDVWLQSREGNLDHSRKVVEILNKVFPDTRIVYALGNHESFPCNSFPPINLNVSQFEPSWFYNAIAEIYADWLPNESLKSMSMAGHYSLMMRRGFRIIVVNSNPCLTYNFWTLYDREDMNGELAWLVSELSAAEANGEVVHIINHVPPGNHDCLGAWGREYSRIIDRFENIIAAQFYGHTHNDEYIVFYDAETNSRPTNVGFVTPSVSSYSAYNMGYRLYTIDGFYPGNSLRVLDTETFIFNLNSANLKPTDRPEYFKFYEGKRDLGLESHFPEDYDRLTRRLATDEIFYEKYLRYFNKGGPGDEHTQRNVVCGMVTTSFIDDRKCVEIMGEP